MAITLLVILAYGCGSLSLVLVLEIISHCVRVVGLTLRESINSTAKDWLLIYSLLLSCSQKLLILDSLHLLECLQILISLQTLQFLIYWVVLSLNLAAIIFDVEETKLFFDVLRSYSTSLNLGIHRSSLFIRVIKFRDINRLGHSRVLILRFEVMIVVIVLLSSVYILLILIMTITRSIDSTGLIGSLSWGPFNESLLAQLLQLRINRILYLRILLTIIYGGVLLYRGQERVHRHWFNFILATSRSIPTT